MEYEHEASGSVVIGSCATYGYTQFYRYPYKIGSRLYILKRALQGYMESVIIKRVNLVQFNGNEPVFNYVDTTNRIWFENELIWQPAALAIATESLTNKANEMAIVSCL